MCVVRREVGNRSGVGEGILKPPPNLLRRIAEEVGTPVYVYDARTIRKNFNELTGSLGGIPHRIHYSVKANSNLSILRLMRELGAGADIVSGGELVRVRESGFVGSDIVFSGVGKTGAELGAALDANVGLINVESSSELQLLSDIADERAASAHFGVRVNPDVATDTHPYTQTGERGMKFGVPLADVLDLVEWSTSRENLDFCSLGVHIGSQIMDAGHYRDAAERLVALVDEIAASGMPAPRSLGMGGGLGVGYVDDTRLDPAAFAEAVRPLWEASGLPITIEPGRFLVGNAGWILTRCIRCKQSGRRKFAVVDAAMNDFLRPSLYGAQHRISVVGAGPESDGNRYDVVGPVCETGDFLGTDQKLPGLMPGALLAISGAGAYGFTMSSTYNSRPRVAEVMADGNRWAIVRERECVRDLMRGEAVSDDQLCWETYDEGK